MTWQELGKSSIPIDQSTPGNTNAVVPKGYYRQMGVFSNGDIINIAAGDGLDPAAYVQFLHAVGAVPYLYNGATIDRQRGNTEITIMASAERTGNIASSIITNYNGRGIMIALDITASSGTGGLQMYLLAEPGDIMLCVPQPVVPIKAIGKHLFIFYPGIDATILGGEGIQIVYKQNIPLPRRFVIVMIHSDSSAYTYSVSGHVIL